MAIEVTPNIVIPDGDISLSFVRDPDQGAKRQQVASAVQLRFDLAACSAVGSCEVAPARARRAPTHRRWCILIIAEITAPRSRIGAKRGAVE